MDDAPPTDRPAGHSPLWVVLVLVALGLAAFFISAVWARRVRQQALSDPAARELLTDDTPPPVGR